MVQVTALMGTIQLLFGCATTASANDHLKTFAWRIGDWRAEVVVEDIPEHPNAGAKAVSLASHKWIADGSGIQSDFTTLVDGEVVRTGREFTLWNYRESQMEQTFVVSTQFSGGGVWEQNGKNYTLKWRGDGPGNNWFEGVSHIMKIDEDTYTWEVKGVKRNGVKIDDWPKRTYHRIQLTDHKGAFESFADLMVGGTWTSTIKGEECEHEYTRTLNRKFVRSAGHTDPNPWDGFFGIDPQNNRLGWWGFFSDGMVGVIHLTKATDTEWKFEGNDFSPAGTVHRKVVITKQSPDKLLSRVEDSLDGKEPAIVEGEWTRAR
jgi:hypothetical protein